MTSNDLIEMLECALEHPCAKQRFKRCATCEIGYRKIVEEPVQLTCGHTICAKCREKIKSGKAQCKKHGETIIGNEASMSRYLTYMKLNDLFDLLSDKFKATIDLLEGNFCILL